MSARRITGLAIGAIAVLVVQSAHGQSPHAQMQTSGPSAADVEEAKKHYARGVQLYNQKADAAALAELERAYALAPNWKILYNLGLVELEMNDFASALRSFEKYRTEGGQGLGAAREREVAGRIAALRDQVATIDVKVNAADAEVLLDDVAVGTSPLGAPLIVNPGHHKLGASKAGRGAESKAVSAAGADHLVVELAIEEAPSVSSPPPVETTPVQEATHVPITPVPIDVHPLPIEAGKEEPAAKSDKTAIVIAWSATGALTVGAIVTGLIALNANGDLTDTKNGRAASIDELNHLASRAHGFAVASDVFTIGAVAAAGASLYLTLRPHKPAAATIGTASASPAPSIDVAVGPANVRLVGTF